jgi:hypothetical protein
MGAFDSELYALGYRRYSSKSEEVNKLTAKDIFRKTVHDVTMPCPGSCGSACPNHNCWAHNGEAYIKPLKKLNIISLMKTNENE